MVSKIPIVHLIMETHFLNLRLNNKSKFHQKNYKNNLDPLLLLAI